MAPDDLDMHLIYDVSHNIAKVEEHVMGDGRQKTLLVHRKGATRAFPPHHPLIPVDYQLTGQPVLIGGNCHRLIAHCWSSETHSGTMGTCSYVLTGTEQGMSETFGSTCHGAVSIDDKVFRGCSLSMERVSPGSSFITSEISAKSQLVRSLGWFARERYCYSCGIAKTRSRRGKIDDRHMLLSWAFRSSGTRLLQECHGCCRDMPCSRY